MIKVGQTYGDDGVKIRIDEVKDNYIIATVVAVDEFWSNPRRISLLCGAHDGNEIWSINFALGQKITFKLTGGKIEGKIGELLPWFILNVENERFEHYR